MNIIICIKQVPKTENIRLKAGDSFSPEGLERRINIFDTYAIEEALRIKEVCPETKIILLTAGSEVSSRSLIEGLSLGADKAYRIDDGRFTGHDSVSTARALSDAIREIEKTEGRADIIMTGRQSTDSSSGLMPVMLSELLDTALVSSVTEVCLSSDGSSLELLKRGSDDFTRLSVSMPVIISMTKGSHEVRFPTFKRIREANRTKIEEAGPSFIDSAHSSTEVLSVIKPGRNTKNSIVDLGDDEEGTALLLKMLSEDSIFKR